MSQGGDFAFWRGEIKSDRASSLAKNAKLQFWNTFHRNGGICFALSFPRKAFAGLSGNRQRPGGSQTPNGSMAIKTTKEEEDGQTRTLFLEFPKIVVVVLFCDKKPDLKRKSISRHSTNPLLLHHDKESRDSSTTTSSNPLDDSRRGILVADTTQGR